MNTLYLILLTVSLLQNHLVRISLAKNFDQSTRFKSVKCTNNSTEKITIHVCKIKVTRNSSSLVFNSTINEPIGSPMYLRVTVQYKYGLIYRPVIPVPPIEVCGLMRNINNAHPVIKAAFDFLGETIKPFLKGCPYLGEYNVTLVVNPRELPSIFPSGMYKVEINVKTPDKKFIEVVTQVEVVSSIKTSF